MLDRSIPLLRDRGLDMRIPDADQSSSEWVARRPNRCQTIIRGRRWKRNVVVLRQGFSGGKGWVDRKAKIRSGAFQIGRDAIGASDNRLVTEHRGRPGKSDTRLEILSSVGTVVQATASWSARHGSGAEIDLGTIRCNYFAGDQVEIDLSVLNLNPGCVSLVAQSEVDS